MSPAEPQYPRDSWQVPEYEQAVLAPKGSRYCVVVFVINEGEKVRAQLHRMRELGTGLDVVVADGGSTDSSLDLEGLRDRGVRALLTKTGSGKLSAQMRMAFSWAMEEQYEGAIVIDGNGKDDVSAIGDFARLLDEGYDHIQGSRFIPGGEAVNTPLIRLLALRLLHAPLVSLASGSRQTDTTNGFRGYSARLICDPEVAAFRSLFVTYELHYHLAIEAARLPRFRTVETPVTRSYPAKGKTPTKISPFRGNAHVLSVLLRAVRGRYRLPSDGLR
jgi:dolichol-phosphate mannosyltransferase